MNTTRTYQPALRLTIALAVIASCDGADVTGPEAHIYSRLDASSYELVVSPLSASFTSPAQVSTGASVPLQLTITNIGDETVGLAHAAYSPVDFVVTDENAVVVWELMFGLNIADAARSETLEPGQALTFSDTWNQRDNRGRSVGPGTYFVRAVFFGNLEETVGSNLWTQPVPLVIE